MIIYTDSLNNLSSDQLKGFFVGWAAPPSPEIHLAILSKSSHRLLAIDDASGDVIGFITAISDGILSAYIPLFEVLRGYQGQGIGRELFSRLLSSMSNLYMIDLVCDSDLQPFYKKMGMNPTTGMSIRNFACQSGNK